MIITPRVVLRLVLVGLVAVVLQVSFLSFLHPLGVTPNLSPVVVAIIGLLGGAVPGAVFGFAFGLVIDSALMGTLGVTSLVLIVVGYLAGRYRESFPLASAVTPALIAGALTLLASAGTAVLEVMLGIDAPVSLLVLREILLQALFAMLIAFVAFPLVRRALRAALVDAPDGGPRSLAGAISGGQSRARRGRGRGRGRGARPHPPQATARTAARRPA